MQTAWEWETGPSPSEGRTRSAISHPPPPLLLPFMQAPGPRLCHKVGVGFFAGPPAPPPVTRTPFSPVAPRRHLCPFGHPKLSRQSNLSSALNPTQELLPGFWVAYPRAARRMKPTQKRGVLRTFSFKSPASILVYSPCVTLLPRSWPLCEDHSPISSAPRIPHVSPTAPYLFPTHHSFSCRYTPPPLPPNLFPRTLYLRRTPFPYFRCPASQLLTSRT